MAAPDATLAALLADALQRGLSVKIRARGASMRPFIVDGSVVELTAPPARLRRGQIVAARRGSALVIHRVHSPGPPVVLRGDNNRQEDRPFSSAEVLGVARRVRTPGGWVMRLDTVLAGWAGRLLVWAVRLAR